MAVTYVARIGGGNHALGGTRLTADHQIVTAKIKRFERRRRQRQERAVEAANAALRPRIWLDAGTEEGDAVIADLRILRDALLETGWREDVDLRYREVPGTGHNEHAWGARFGEVLRYLFPHES